MKKTFVRSPRHARSGWRFLFVPLLVACAVHAEDALPIYEVSVAADERVWLTNAVFNVTTADGTETGVKGESIDFAGGGTFKKRGAGELVSHLKLEPFTGEVRVEEGAMIVYANGHLGQDAGVTVVSNGAAVVLMTGKDYSPGPEDFAANDKLFGTAPYKEKFILSGGGTPTWPGAVVNAGTSQFYSMCNTVVLSNDTALATLAQRLDIRGAALYMNGYRLTLRGVENGQLGFTRAPVYSGGDIDVDGVNFIMEGEPTPNVFEGDQTHVLHLMNGATLQRSRSGQAPAWTLQVDPGCAIIAGQYNSFMTESFNRWLGPVILNANVAGPNGTNVWFSFEGPVSGTGGITAAKKGWIYLKGTNTYEGLMAINGTSPGTAGSGIRLFSPSAAPAANTNGFKLTNAELKLEPATESYDLSKVVFAGDGTNRLSGAVAQVASLRMEGAGLLELDAKCSVTGRTELLAGTMRLPSLENMYRQLYGGVVEASQVFSQKSTSGGIVGASNFFADQKSPTNDVSVQQSLRYAYGEAPWGGQLVNEYTGWLWNTNSTDVIWSFFLLAPSRGRLYIDDEVKIYQSTWGTHGKANVTLAPGAHKFRLAMYGDNVSSAKFRTPQNDGLVWRDNFCFAYDPQGRLSTNVDDYEKLDVADTGLFSRTNMTFEQIVAVDGLAEGLTRFDELCLHPAATLDCNFGELAAQQKLSVTKLVGAGTVTNGGLSVASWQLLAADAPATLTVDGTLAFAEGCELTADDVALLPRNTEAAKRYTLYSAKSVVGAPVLSDGLKAAHWHLAPAADGKSCELYHEAATVVFLR